MVQRAPLTPAERRECYRYHGEWMIRRANPHQIATAASPLASEQPRIDIGAVVSGRIARFG